MFAALRLAAPPLRRESYDLEQFIDELAVPSGRIRAISVQKRRTRYTIGGCMSELSEVVADGKAIRTIAVESEDAAAVIAAVRSLGLGGYANTSYPVGLAALIDGTPSRYAVIDAGTNSIKFHVAERASDGTWRTIADRAEITRLGEGLDDTRRISEAALDRRSHRRCGHGSRSAQTRRAGRGGRRYGRPAHCGERRSSRRPDRGAHRYTHRGDLRRGGSATRISRRLKSGLGLQRPALDFDTGGGNSQFMFGGARKCSSASASMSAPCATPSDSGRIGPCHPKVLKEALAAISRTCRDSTAAWRPMRWRRWAARRRTLLRSGTGSPGRSGRRAGHGARSSGDHGNRAVPLDGRGRPPRDRRPGAEACRSHPGPCVHHPYRDGDWGRRRYRQRPRPAPRRDGGTLSIMERSRTMAGKKTARQTKVPMLSASRSPRSSRCSRTSTASAELVAPSRHAPRDHRPAPPRPHRGRSATGLLLRHAQPRPEQAGVVVRARRVAGGAGIPWFSRDRSTRRRSARSCDARRASRPKSTRSRWVRLLRIVQGRCAAEELRTRSPARCRWINCSPRSNARSSGLMRRRYRAPSLATLDRRSCSRCACG